MYLIEEGTHIGYSVKKENGQYMADDVLLIEDAKLISASPELLDACKMAIMELLSPCSRQKTLEMLDQAIDKATK